MHATLSSTQQARGHKNAWSSKLRSKHVVHLFWRGTGAKSVEWVGDYNGWQCGATPYKKEPVGWSLTLELPHGHHRYLVVVDGQPALDPASSGTVKDEEGNSYSVVAVS